MYDEFLRELGLCKENMIAIRKFMGVVGREAKSKLVHGRMFCNGSFFFH